MKLQSVICVLVVAMLGTALSSSTYAVEPFANPQVYASEEFQFIAHFPSDFEKVELDSAMGPYLTVMSFDEESGVIFRIDAHKVTAIQKYADMTGEGLRTYLKNSFEKYSKTKGNSQAKSQWNDEFEWPILEYTIAQDGAFKEGVTTKKAAYTFVKNKIHYTVSISTIPNLSTPTGRELKMFMSGFISASPELIREYKLNE